MLQVALKQSTFRRVSMVMLARALSEEPCAQPVDVGGETRIQRSRKATRVSRIFPTRSRKVTRISAMSPKIRVQEDQSPGEAVQSEVRWRKLPQRLSRRLASAMSTKPRPLLSSLETVKDALTLEQRTPRGKPEHKLEVSSI